MFKVGRKIERCIIFYVQEHFASLTFFKNWSIFDSDQMMRNVFKRYQTKDDINDEKTYK